MSDMRSPTLARLQAANPAPVQHDLGRSEDAQITLRRILSGSASQWPRPHRGRRSRLPRGGLGVTLAALVIGGGAAFAATDPFGWISASPNTAKYEIKAVRVRVPVIGQIACRSAREGGLTCSPRGSGQRYMLASTVAPAPPASVFSRARFAAAIAHAQARHQISTATAARFRHDLARVPDSFFLELRLAMRYQTIGTADDRVPPVGVPEWVVCQGTRTLLTCRNLNGDRRVPVGARIYMAQVASDWRRAPRTPPDYGMPPGISFSKAGARLMIDFLRSAMLTASSSRPSTRHSGG